jgi:hypothetical protein
MIGFLSDERLANIPAAYRDQHEFCFYLHDAMVSLLKGADEVNASTLNITFETSEELDCFVKKNDPIGYVLDRNETDIARRIALNQVTPALFGDLEDLLRGTPANEVVNGILEEIGGRTDAVEIKAVTEIFHITGRDDTSLWEGLSAEARKALRNYLNAAVPTVLAQDDFSGQLKGYFATVMAQVGEPSDLATIERLVEADIERVRTGRLARAADHRSKQGNGAVMSWTSWYVQAMIHLASDSARDLLIRLLADPDYEQDAAWGLFQLARSERSSPLFRARAWPMRSKNYSDIWKAREGQAESNFQEPQRTELAAVLREHIEKH